MHKTVEQWRAVKAEAVTSAGVARATNVLQMALDDIQELCRDGWQDISTAPKDGTPILILTNYGKMATAFSYDPNTTDHSWIDWMRAEHSYGSVSHYQPLPKPPVTK